MHLNIFQRVRRAKIFSVRMAEKEKKKSKTEKVICRVESCQLEMLLMNYAGHLKGKHPEENTKNLRAYGVKTFSFSKFHGQGRNENSVQEQEESNDESLGIEPLNTDEPEDKDSEVKMTDLKRKREDENSNVLPSKEIYQMVKEMAQRVGPVDVSDCSNEKEATLKRIRVVSSTLDVLQGVKSLEGSVNILKGAFGVKEQVQEDKKANVDEMLNCAKSIADITEKVCEFEYEVNKAGGKMICDLCKEEFKYSNKLNQDFYDEKMGVEFSNLKKSLKRHLKSDKHTLNLKDKGRLDLVEDKLEGKDQIIGLKIGRIAYYLLRHGRPDTDYTVLVQMSVANGINLGDINHSE